MSERTNEQELGCLGKEEGTPEKSKDAVRKRKLYNYLASGNRLSGPEKVESSLKVKETLGVPAVAQWVKNLTAAAQVTSEVQ